MRTSAVIARIKLLCPGFATVAHALTSAADADLPSALVTPAKMVANPDRLIGALHSQDVMQTFSVYILMQRRQDGDADAGAADDLDDLTDQLRAALPGWAIDANHAPMQFVGGQLDRFETGLVCWREDYAVEYEIRL